jgi:hypothetical protein
MVTRLKQGNLSWFHRDNQGQYLQLETVNLNVSTHFNGVYVIWRYDQNGTVVTAYTGQGFIKRRLTDHKQEYAGRTRYVAWADVSVSNDRDGIERFLFNILQPTDTKRAPDVRPLPVNLPPPW